MTESTKPDRAAPTEKMLAAAKRAAERHGVKLPNDALVNFETCRLFLDEFLNKATPKQISFGQKIAKDKGIPFPEELVSNAKELSVWLDENK